MIRLRGHGIGLRARHYGQLLDRAPPADFVEAISENFFAKGGRPLAVLEKVRRDVPVALHGVSLSIGSTDPLSEDYLRALCTLVNRIDPAVVSDHFCWGSHGGRYAHDLWPLPYTEDTIIHVAARVATVQDRLRRRILLENVSSYVGFQASTMPEWEFVTAVAQRAGCGVLLDINNIYVSAKNQGFEPRDYLNGIPRDVVGQFHLAGHTDKGNYLLDSHIGPVPESVWNLYAAAVQRFGPVPALVEWDEEVPALEVLAAEAQRAADVEAAALREAA